MDWSLDSRDYRSRRGKYLGSWIDGEGRSAALASMQGAVTLRSARCQSAYWDNGHLRLVNYLTRGEDAPNPVVLEIIRFFFSPRTLRDALLEFDTYSPESVGEAILKLIDAQLLLECDSPGAARDDLLDSLWRPWLPHGGYHFLTKDAPYAGDDWTLEQKLQAIGGAPQPPLFKKTDGAKSMSLPIHEKESDSFFKTLHARRTRRIFSQEPASLDSVSKLLQTTWGVQ